MASISPVPQTPLRDDPGQDAIWKRWLELLWKGANTATAAVANGDKGDITVTSSGLVWTIDSAVVTLAKMANMATSSLIYRKTASSGVPEVNTLATLKTDLLLTGTNSGDQTSIVGITGTIAQFNTACTDADFGTGTVTSVAVSGANGIGVTGSPITTTGTIALSLGAITPTSVAATGTVSAAMGTGAGTAIAVGKANVNTTAVGNVGTGTDDLITYSLPTNSLSAAGKGVRITAWGTKANNANAKTVTINFGSTVMASLVMDVGVGGQWMAESVVISTGTDTQTYNATVQQHNTAFTNSILIDHGVATSAQDDGAAITIKCTGIATSNNDIVQNGLLVEFIG